MKKYSRGFTLIELLAVIVVLAIILVIAIPQILKVIRNSTMGAMESDAKLVLNAIQQRMALDSEFDPTQYNSNLQGLLDELGISGDNYNAVSFIHHNSVWYITVEGKSKYDGFTACGSFHSMNVINGECDLDFTPPVLVLNGVDNMEVEFGDAYTELGVTATDNKDESVTVTTTGTVNTSAVGDYTITYSATDSSNNTTTLTRTVKVMIFDYSGPGYVARKSVNGPVLATGMTPQKWNGTNWVDTTINDKNWYNYGTTSATRNWANAKTLDGSMWVWIPRYAYQIASNYHLATAGTINIKFLQGTTTTAGDSSTVDTVPAYSESSQTNYILHPAFNFGGTPITGIWVAKFEASPPSGSACYTTTNDTNCNITTILPRSISNTKAWRYITPSNMFTVCRNMETSNVYGWGTTGTNIDTHMMKNIEWGAVTYLSKSTFGKNGDVSGGEYTTLTTGTNYTTNTSYSTTGNVYGIYDMSGSSQELVAGYVNNGSTILNDNGSVLVAAASKYKDVYTKAGTESDVNNYALIVDKKGDAMYETSAAGTSANSWYTKPSDMAYGSYPFVTRGGYTSGMNSLFSFRGENAPAVGGGSASTSFRPVILVQTGL